MGTRGQVSDQEGLAFMSHGPWSPVPCLQGPEHRASGSHQVATGISHPPVAVRSLAAGPAPPRGLFLPAAGLPPGFGWGAIETAPPCTFWLGQALSRGSDMV